MNKRIVASLFCLTLLSQSSFGQIVTDRPDQTESSSTVTKGSLQIESGFLIGFSTESKVTERSIAVPSTLFRIGMTNWLELRVFNQFESVKSSAERNAVNGISDLELGFKVELYGKEEACTEMAFLSHVVFPTGSKGLSNKKFGSINKLSISHGFTDKIGIGYNLGYNYFSRDRGDFTYSFVLGVRITDKLSIYAEPYGEWVNFKDFLSDFDAGFTYLVKENLQLDCSFGLGMNHKMNYISVGFSWNTHRSESKD